MAKFYIFVVIVLFIIFIFLLLSSNQREHFPKQITSLRLSSVAKNILLDKYDRIKERTLKPPLPRGGETLCTKVVCPSKQPETVVCWKCN